MKKTEIGGYVGMALIHSATLPATIGTILGANTVLPPLSMVLLVWAGLALFLVRAIAQNDRLYIISNSFGFIMQSIMLALIIFPWG
jgi:hypothetical protein